VRIEWQLTKRASFRFIEQLFVVDVQKLATLSFSEIARGLKLKAACPKVEWQVVRTYPNSNKRRNDDRSFKT